MSLERQVMVKSGNRCVFWQHGSRGLLRGLLSNGDRSTAAEDVISDSTISTRSPSGVLYPDL